MKILLILILLIFPAFLHAQNDDEAQKRIDSIIETIEKRSENSHQSFTIKKRKYTEQWTYSTANGKIEFFSVSYFARHTKRSETYFLQNDELIYAAEREDYYSGDNENTEELTSWSGNYYFENRILVYLTTNGHGKSETDDWEPERETLDMFRKRLKTLKKKLKLNNHKKKQ